MGFFDSLTKAVSDTVDRGKKEVDQFMRIQKVKGEIGQVEQAIRDAGVRGQQVRQEIGDMVIARLRAGTLADADLQAHADRAAAIEKEIAVHHAAIVEKREQIARIEAEAQVTAPAPPPLPVAPASVPVAPASVPVAPASVPVAPASVPATASAPPPLPVAPASVPAIPPVATTCSQCGAAIAASATSCTECGAKLA
jgi:hypothetical protein